jgi:hypothetical protein
VIKSSGHSIAAIQTWSYREIGNNGIRAIIDSVNAGISTPVAPIPIAGLLFVQLYTVFGIAPENKITADDCPLQTV